MPGFGPRQLALALDHSESFARDDFLAGPPNEAALTLIERWPDWPARTILLVGPEGAGKSHLAAIWAEKAGARLVAARALDSVNLPDMLATGALVVEDLVPRKFDERALFHLINLVREQDSALLITARDSTFEVTLNDLASRLRALPVVNIAAPDDTLLRAVIVKQFADRQLAVDEGLIAYLLARIERSFAAVRAAVDRLDREALRQQRPVTRSLAGELFRG